MPVQLLLLALGVLALATSVIFIKQSTVDPVLLSGLRLAIGAAALTPLFVRDWRRRRGEVTWRHVRDASIPGVVLALHFTTWIIGARMTLAANATLIVNTAPILMPLLLTWLAHEPPTRREAAATAIAFAGLAVMIAADFRLGEQFLVGDLICAGSMLTLAVYLALGRRFRHHPTIWLYLVPLYYSAAAASFAAAPLLAQETSINWRQEWPWVLALGLVPTVIGHSLVNNAMRHFRGQVVSLAAMTQFVFAGMMAYLIWPSEKPDWSFYPASVLVLTAGVIAVRRAC